MGSLGLVTAAAGRYSFRVLGRGLGDEGLPGRDCSSFT